MFEVYFPVFLMLLVAVAIPCLLFTLATVLGPNNPNPIKLAPYESGSQSTGAQHLRLSVKFYLTAILFVVFDIEAVFLYPWAAQFRELGWFGLVEMLLFLVVLGVTLLYAWKKGALEWER
jgi:NADH-quinone oxidoreductase subunit A